MDTESTNISKEYKYNLDDFCDIMTLDERIINEKVEFSEQFTNGKISLDKEMTDDEKKEMEKFRPEVEKNMRENEKFLHERIDYTKLNEMNKTDLSSVEINKKLCDCIEKSFNSDILNTIRSNFKSLGFFRRIKVFFLDLYYNIFKHCCLYKKSNGYPFFKHDFYLFKKHFAFKMSELTKKRVSWAVAHNIISE